LTTIVALNAFKEHLYSQVCKAKLVNGSSDWVLIKAWHETRKRLCHLHLEQTVMNVTNCSEWL